MTNAICIEGQSGVDPAIDLQARRQFRDCLGQFATGVTIMTCLNQAGTRSGITVNSFSSLSLDPPLILWSLALTSSHFTCFHLGDAFAVNVLSMRQEQLARRFARSDGDKLEGANVHTGLDGVPLVEGCAAYLECRVEARYPGGDHEIIVGIVRRIFNVGHRPLLFHGGLFQSLAAL